MCIRLNWKNDIILITILFLGLVYNSFIKFSFGYEYEDTVVYTWYALDSEICAATKKFRTAVIEREGEVLQRHNYSGHYITYGLYLKLFSYDVFRNRPDFIHKIANTVLLFISVLALCYHHKRLQALLLLSAITTHYVFSSSLAENLSVTLSILMLLEVKRANYLISLILAGCLIMVKRDCLIYLLPLFFYLIKDNKTSLIFAFTPLLLLYMWQVNPFYTEFIESEGLDHASFSFLSFTQQAPYYLAFSLSPLLTPLLFMDFRKGKIFAFTFFVGLLMYSMHYRSYYVLFGLESFSEFHSWRYLYNLLPLLLILDIKMKRMYMIGMVVILYVFNLYRYNKMISEEDLMYRKGEYIDSEFFIKSELNKLFLESYGQYQNNEK